jgi:asparagine synthase (glutamine-hydrolysing)
VAALAAPALAQQGQRLTAYVHRPRFGPDSGHLDRTQDEWPLAQATAQLVGNIDAVACPTEHMSPVEGIHRWLDMAGIPMHGACNAFWLIDIAEQAATHGASVLLTGQLGNATVSWAGTGDLRGLLHRKGVSAVVAELRADGSGWWAATRNRLAKPALRPAWHRLRKVWGDARRRHPGWHDFALLRPEFVDELGLEDAMRQANHDPSFTSVSAQRVQLFRLSLLGGADNGLAAWSALGQASGLAVRDPTRDRRLVELCWRLPDELFWANGRGRGLIRQGMRDRLPREVLDCSQKGLQASDLHARLRDCRGELLSQVEEVCRHAVARQWLDVARLKAVSAAAVTEGPGASGMAPLAHMLRALAAGMFIVRNA